MRNTSKLIISEGDYEALLQLVEQSPSPATDALEAEISRANIVKRSILPNHVVAMNSQVEFTDMDTGETQTITLVYPQHADVNHHRISILSPVGSALIGLATGGTIEWPMPQGKTRRLRVSDVKQQEYPV